MSSFQGFDIKLNLSENTDDRDVLNNLGIAPIADDIALFTNNLRNTSEISVTVDRIQGNTIRLNPLSQRFVFTDGTKIKVFSGETELGDAFVGNSNNVNEFQLYLDANLTQLVVPPAGVDVRYVRSDAITKSDILNLVKQRDPVVEIQTSSQLIPSTDSLDAVSSNPYTSLRRVYSLIQNTSTVLSDYINAIESELDIFQQKSQKSISNNSDFETDQRPIVTGSVVVNDPNNINVSSVSTTSGPGIFILDTATNQAKRAFSDNENAWTAEPVDPLVPLGPEILVAATREAVIGNLVIEDGVRIIRRAGFPEIGIETGSVNTFTHYVKVIVNGEEYSLCLK